MQGDQLVKENGGNKKRKVVDVIEEEQKTDEEQEGVKKERNSGRPKNAAKHTWNEVYVYRITCLANDKVYVGMSNDVSRRVTQHRNKPNAQMKDDVGHYKPWEDFFKVDILRKCFTKQHAQEEEQR